MPKPFVSVVMPVFNESKFIDACVDSLLQQDYPLDSMEWIFVDGGSTDNTRELLLRRCKEHPQLIKVLDNPDKTVPYAMNIGIAESRGEVIVRLDAHAEYATNYISQCVAVLEEIGADNVGGVATTKSRGYIGGVIAKMLSSKFGVGNSQFRTDGNDGFVDTVPFGAFRREVFEKWGGYDERLTRNQDNEMNYRIRSNGGKIYLSKRIRFSYYCRDSVGGIAKMAIQNGTWNVITMKLCPGSMGVRHFVPLAFVLSLVLLPPLGWLFAPFRFVLLFELLAYLILDVVFSAQAADRAKDFVILLVLFPIFHITYGIGSLCGIWKLLSRQFA